MTAVMTPTAAHTVERPCPHSIVLGPDADGRLNCVLKAGHLGGHRGRFAHRDGVTAGRYVSCRGVVEWEVNQ